MRKFLRVLGLAAAGLAAVLVVVATVVYVSSNNKLRKTYNVTARPVLIPTSAAAIARGKHVAETRGCNECHGKDYAGAKVIDDGAIGTLWGPNLTRGKGSVVAEFRDEDWVRAIRHGVAPDGRGLILMPSEEYSHFSDEDLGSVIAFLKTVPAVERERVPIAPGPVTRVLLTLGKMKLPAEVIDHPNIAPLAPVKAATPEYGRYIAYACIGCHGPNLSGGKIDIGPPDWPQARNLTPDASGELARWTEADFFRAMREGKRPDGSALSEVMPRAFGGMEDVELRALFLFLRSLPPVPTGQR